MTAIVCLIATYRDEALLERAVASAAPHVDRVIVLDGAYAGLDVASSSHEHELVNAAVAGADVFRPGPSATLWPNEISKRNVLLELGRALVPEDADRWALVLDADEELVNGAQLREYVAAFGPSWLALPIVREEPDGAGWEAPSRLFRLTDWLKYRGRSYWLLDAVTGARVDLSHARVDEANLGPRSSLHSGAWRVWPYVRHHWDERSPGRQELQREWGRRLAEFDHGAAP